MSIPVCRAKLHSEAQWNSPIDKTLTVKYTFSIEGDIPATLLPKILEYIWNSEEHAIYSARNSILIYTMLHLYQSVNLKDLWSRSNYSYTHFMAPLFWQSGIRKLRCRRKSGLLIFNTVTLIWLCFIFNSLYISQSSPVLFFFVLFLLLDTTLSLCGVLPLQ